MLPGLVKKVEDEVEMRVDHDELNDTARRLLQRLDVRTN